MAKNGEKEGSIGSGFMGLGGLLGGLGNLIDKLGDLAEKGGELRKSGEIRGLDPEGKVRGVYGFSIRTGLGDEWIKVEPFGNIRKDDRTGRSTVQEVCEPLVDVFDEDDYVLVVAEMPGIGEEDAQLELKEDILTITAERGEKKFRKEVLLPEALSQEKMSCTCRNGVFEIKLVK